VVPLTGPAGLATAPFWLVKVTVTGTPTAATKPAPGIQFDSATGILTIQGAAGVDNIASVSVTTVSGVQMANVQIYTRDHVTLATLFNQSQFIPLSQVTYIYFYGQMGMSTTFVDSTAIACTAYAGSGINMLQGGDGNDRLYAGGAGSSNTLKGMGGDDYLVGVTGDNWLYGGTGNNTLIAGPGPGQNFLYPNS
jgi:Ca2+-binding RTX toxin-like protein